MTPSIIYNSSFQSYFHLHLYSPCSSQTSLTCLWVFFHHSVVASTVASASSIPHLPVSSCPNHSLLQGPAGEKKQLAGVTLFLELPLRAPQLSGSGYRWAGTWSVPSDFKLLEGKTAYSYFSTWDSAPGPPCPQYSLYNFVIELWGLQKGDCCHPGCVASHRLPDETGFSQSRENSLLNALQGAFFSILPGRGFLSVSDLYHT